MKQPKEITALEFFLENVLPQKFLMENKLTNLQSGDMLYINKPPTRGFTIGFMRKNKTLVFAGGYKNYFFNILQTDIKKVVSVITETAGFKYTKQSSHHFRLDIPK